MSPEGLRVARHFQADVETLDHAEVAHGLADGLVGDVDHPARAHPGGEAEAVVVDVGDHHEAGAHMAADGGGHDADGPGPGNQHVLADQVEGQRRVGGVAQGIEDGGDVVADVVGQGKGVDRRDRQVLGEAARPVDPDAHGVAAQMPAPGPAVAAMAAGHVALAGDPLADLEAGDFHAEIGDGADELVAHGHGHRNGALRPVVPVVDVNIGAADRGLSDLDQHVVMADRGLGHLLHPDAGFRLGLDQGFHGNCSIGGEVEKPISPPLTRA